MTVDLDLETASPRPYIREVPITALVDTEFKDLFPQDPKQITAIAASMRAHGFTRSRPIDVWRNRAGRGRHMIVEGHQRFTAAKKAGLETVFVVYHDFASFDEALLFAAQQQGLRRNASREQQTLGVLRLMWKTDGTFRTTRELTALYKFAPATIDRAKQLIQQGNESEILAVLEGTHGLLKGYEAMLKRLKKKTDRPAPAKRPPVLTALRNDLAKAIDGGKFELPEALRHARWLLNYLDGQAPDVPTEDEEDDDDDN